jgi:hypothetical protein
MKTPYSRTLIIIGILLLSGLAYLLYEKYSFTEEMARNYANRFLNTLMIKNSSKEFSEIYPTFGSGLGVVLKSMYKVTSITKRDDGNFEVYASDDDSKIDLPPIYFILNRKGKILSSRGVSYAYYDKSLEYGKKLGCLTGSETDTEIESILAEKGIRRKLDLYTDIELRKIERDINISGKISSMYSITSGTVVITNNTPYNIQFTDLKCYVLFYNSNGTLIDSQEVSFINLPANGNVSQYVSSTNSYASRYEFKKEITTSLSLKNKIKEYLILYTNETCN